MRHVRARLALRQFAFWRSSVRPAWARPRSPRRSRSGSGRRSSRPTRCRSTAAWTSARRSPAVAQRRVPYHCIDLVDPGAPYSAALYQQAARDAIEDISARSHGSRARRRHRALRSSGARRPGVPCRASRSTTPRGATTSSTPRSTARPRSTSCCVERDPDSAAVVHQNNTRRVVRALEMLDERHSLRRAATQGSRRATASTTRVFVGLTMDRERLYAAIDARVDAMIDGGLLDEVERCSQAGLRGRRSPRRRRSATRSSCRSSRERPSSKRPSRRSSRRPGATRSGS